MMGSEIFSDILWTFLDVFRHSHDDLRVHRCFYRGTQMFSICGSGWSGMSSLAISGYFLATLSDPKLLSNGSMVSDYTKELDDF